MNHLVQKLKLVEAPRKLRYEGGLPGEVAACIFLKVDFYQKLYSFSFYLKSGFFEVFCMSAIDDMVVRSRHAENTADVENESQVGRKEAIVIRKLVPPFEGRGLRDLFFSRVD